MVGYLPYIFFLGVCLACSAADLLINKRKVALVCASVILLFFYFLAVFRDVSVGIDTAVYSVTYQGAPKYTFLAFVLKNKPEFFYYGGVHLFSATLHVSERVFWFFCYGLICVFLLLSCTLIKNPSFYLSLFMFFGFQRMALSGIRQAVAWSIVTYSFLRFLFSAGKLKKRFVISAFLVVFAAGFHVSALIMLLCLLLSFIKLKKELLMPLVLLTIPLGIVLIGSTSELLLLVKGGYYYPGTNRISFQYIGFLLSFIAFFVLCEASFLSKFRAKINFRPPQTGFVFHTCCWACFLFLAILATNVGSTVFTRFAMYFYAAIIAFFAGLLSCFKKRRTSLVLSAIFFVGFGLFYLKEISTLGGVPYEFSFSF